MKVALDLTPLSTRSRFRGIGTYVRGLVKGFGRIKPQPGDPEVVLLVGRAPHFRVISLPRDGQLTFHDLERPPMGYQTYYFLKRLAVGKAMVQNNIDLFHATDPKGIPRSSRYRTVTVCLDLIPSLLGGRYLPPLVPRRASVRLDQFRYQRADHIIAISETTRNDMMRVLGMGSERISVVHLGVDTELFNATTSPTDASQVAQVLGSDRPYFFYVGGFDSRKQVPLLVEAFARRIRELDEILLIAGSMSSRMNRTLRELVSLRGVADRVRLAGFVPAETIASLYRRATAHPLLTLYEGFGLTLVEAMACGCPVLSLRSSCVPEIVGEAALLLENRDLTNSVGEALVRLSREEDTRKELRQRGLARATQFSWETCATKTLEVYRQVLAFN